MKKLMIMFLMLSLVVLSACGNKLIEIPLEVPDGADVEFPVDEPDPEVPTETETPTDPTVPEVEVVIEIIEKYIEVPAEVEMMRKYTPGTYFAASEDVNPSGGYSFVVVVIDSYGDIAGVHIDETFSSRVLYANGLDELYYFIEGDGVTIPNTFRKIDKDLAYKNYPHSDDAITTDDLIEGIHSEVIQLLRPIQVNETKVYLNGDLNMGSPIDFKTQIGLMVEKVIKDNTTYGFNLYSEDNKVKTDSVAGVSIAVDNYLLLIQEILDKDAKLTQTTVLADKAEPNYGLYKTGTYVDYSDREVTDKSLNFGLSVTVVDEFGVIAGVYLDETADDLIIEGSFSTKGIMKESFGLSSLGGYEWYEQSSRFATQILHNQGVDGLNYYGLDVLSDEIPTTISVSGDEEYYTDSVTGVGIRVDRMAQAVKKSLDRALYTEYFDGVYVVQGNDDLLSVITVENSKIEDIYLDRIKTVFQAQYEYLGEEYGLYKFIRSFDLGDSTVLKALMVYEKDGLYYSPIDLEELKGIELSNSQELDKDEEVDLSTVELAGLVVVPGNYTAAIAGDSEYVNLFGWKENNDKLIAEIVKNNGTHTLLLDGGDYIIDEDILYYDVSNVIEAVNQGMYLARGNNRTFTEVGSNTSNLLSDGEFFVSGEPNTMGQIPFGYMNIVDGNITTLYFDKTILTNDGTSTLFVGSDDSDVSWKAQIIDFVEVVINNQGYIINSILDDYVYYDQETLNHVHDDLIFDIEGIDIELTEYIEVFEQLINESVQNRLKADANYIQNYLMNSDDYFNGLYFLTHQILPDFLPTSFVDQSLANEYELEWISSNTRDLDLDNPENGLDIEIDDDITENQKIELTMIVRLPGGEHIIDSFTYSFDIFTRNAEGVMLLNDPDFKLQANYIMEFTSYDLPTNEAGSIKWVSSAENVISNSGEAFDVDQDTDVVLTAYVDIDANGSKGIGEPSKDFVATVLTNETAIKRVRDSIELSNIYQYIDRDFILSNKSPVWGLTYEWKVFNPYITLIDHTTYTEVKVIRAGYDVNVTFTADLSIGSSNIDVEKQIKILEGNKGVYEEYAQTDLDMISFNYDLQNLLIGDDLNFDEMIVGSLRESDITFEVSDFGMFIDANGLVIANHATKDAEFTIIAKAKFNSGGESDFVEKEWKIRILSSDTMNENVLEDKEELVEYQIDLSHNSHLDVQLTLPTTGLVNDSVIVWTVADSGVLPIEKFDVSRLDEGIITILTKNGTLLLTDLDSFELTAELSLGDVSTTKNIEVNLRD